jgi:hypothetical protein
VESGKSETLKIRRINLAERLYRVTGAGIYRDTVLTGEPPPLREPLLNAQVFGSDSVVNAVYRGKLHWFWGDTNRPAYVLGNFHVPGAVSELPGKGGLDPAVGVDLRYYVDENGFARSTCKMEGEGPTWIDGLTVLRDDDGKERMFAAYAKVKPPLTVYRRGLAEWNDEEERFEHIASFDNVPLHSVGHTFQREEDGVRYVYFSNPFPLRRVPATSEAIRDPQQYEAYTCLKEGSRLDDPQLDRDRSGQLRYSWKRGTPPIGPGDQAKLVHEGRAKQSELLLQLRDRDTGKAVTAHGGSVYWNEYRRRWVMIAVEIYGSSLLGEVWHAEADAPEGPWCYAVKVVTHDKYSFYNPKQHPMFDQEGGRLVYFEGTYTHTFSGNTDVTPRYDYNQIMYRLDLGDPRVPLPVAVYSRDGDAIPDRFRAGLSPEGEFKWSDVAFFAFDRPADNVVPIYAVSGEDGAMRLSREPAEQLNDAPLFYAIPPDAADRPEATVPLLEFLNSGSGRFAYSADPNWRRDGFRRSEGPLAYVWPNPADRN